MSELKVGQKIYLRYCGFDHRRSRDIIEASISKIGNKYFYITGENYFGSDKFEIETLQQCTDGNYPYTVYLSMEEIKIQDEYNALNKEIKNAFNGYGKLPFSLIQLRAIKEIINQENKSLS